MRAWAWRWRIWLLIGLGSAIRIALAIGDAHTNFDIDSYLLVNHALHTDPLHVYASVPSVHWPYPPTFFPWLFASSSVAHQLALPFSAVVKLPVIAADGALTWLLHAELMRRGRSPSTSFAAASLVALGPVFVLNSSFHGQIDSLAILPAVAGLVAWRRFPAGRRAVVAGALIGLAGSIKSPAGLVLLALLPVCASRREALLLVGASLGVVALVLAPFLASTPTAVARSLTFSDVPGVGGLYFVLFRLHHLGLAHRLNTHPAFVLAPVLVLVAGILWRRRPVPPMIAASLLWLGVLAFVPSFFFGYLIWGIPFFLLAGYFRSTALLMAAVTLPGLQFETGHIPDHFEFYAWAMTAVWASFPLAFAMLARRVWTAPPGSLKPTGRT